VSVLVLEAGKTHVNDPKIDMPVQYGATFGDPEVRRISMRHCVAPNLYTIRDYSMTGPLKRPNRNTPMIRSSHGRGERV